MFYNWIEDQLEESERTHKEICLLGSFWNPEAAKELLGIGNSQKVSVSDEDFEKAVEYVSNTRKETPKSKRKRKKKLVIKN